MANKIKKRGRYSAAMKEEVAWQATLGQKTDEQIASEYQISVAQVQQWRDEGKAAFSGAFRSTQNDAKMKKLRCEPFSDTSTRIHSCFIRGADNLMFGQCLKTLYPRARNAAQREVHTFQGAEV